MTALVSMGHGLGSSSVQNKASVNHPRLLIRKTHPFGPPMEPPSERSRIVRQRTCELTVMVSRRQDTSTKMKPTGAQSCNCRGRRPPKSEEDSGMVDLSE